MGERGLAFASIGLSPQLSVSNCEYLTALNRESLVSKLRETVSSLQLTGTPCNIALSDNDYSLLLVDPPKVPEEELRDAIRWKVKELSPIPIDEAVLDVFRMPDDAGSVGKGMVFTVVAKQQAVDDLVALCTEAELKVNAIDIPELCLRNFAALNKGSKSQLIARLMADSSQVVAFSKDCLYLSRHFNFRYAGGSLTELEAETLTLELQRSADYLHHQMHQPTPNQILLMGNGLQSSDLPPSINDSFAGEVKVLDASMALPVAPAIDDVTVSKCAVAIGAALRDALPDEGASQ